MRQVVDAQLELATALVTQWKAMVSVQDLMGSSGIRNWPLDANVELLLAEAAGLTKGREPTYEASFTKIYPSWRRFLRWTMPWLRSKWDLASAVADARLAQEIARAEQMQAAAALTTVLFTQEAFKTVALARKLERQSLSTESALLASPAELEEQMDVLLEKLRELGLKHGTRLHFSAEIPPPTSSNPLVEADTEGAPDGSG